MSASEERIKAKNLHKDTSSSPRAHTTHVPAPGPPVSCLLVIGTTLLPVYKVNSTWAGDPTLCMLLTLSCQHLNALDSHLGFPGGSVGKNPPVMQETQADKSWIPRSGRSLGGWHGNPLLDSCLENPMDRGAWRATVYRVTKSRTQLKRLSTEPIHLKTDKYLLTSSRNSSLLPFTAKLLSKVVYDPYLEFLTS